MAIPTQQLTGQLSRSHEIDVARGLGIFLVLYGHALEIIIGTPLELHSEFAQWRWIYSFHMPLFFFVSGTVYRPRSGRGLIGSVLSLVLLAYLSHVVGWVISKIIGIPNTSPQSLIVPFFTAVNLYTVVVWFLIALAMVQVFYHVVDGSGASGKFILWLLLVAAFVVGETLKRNYLYISTLLPAALFYVLGANFRVASFFNRSRAAQWLLFAFAGLSTIILASLNNGCLLYKYLCSSSVRPFAVSMASGNIGFVPLFIASAIAGILMILALARILVSGGTVASRFFGWMGEISLSLLLVNGLILTFVNPLLRSYLSRSAPGMLLVLLPFLATIAQIMIFPFTARILMLTIRSSRLISVWLVSLTFEKFLSVHPPEKYDLKQ